MAIEITTNQIRGLPNFLNEKYQEFLELRKELLTIWGKTSNAVAENQQQLHQNSAIHSLCHNMQSIPDSPK